MSAANGDNLHCLVGRGWEVCERDKAERVMWRKGVGPWIGPMPLGLCIWPRNAEYVFSRQIHAPNAALTGAEGVPCSGLVGAADRRNHETVDVD